MPLSNPSESLGNVKKAPKYREHGTSLGDLHEAVFKRLKKEVK